AMLSADEPPATTTYSSSTSCASTERIASSRNRPCWKLGVTIEIMRRRYSSATRDGDTVIAATLVGGLGNQLFQYAAGRSLALRHKTDLVLDLSLLLGAQEELATPRRYELGCYDIRARTVAGVRSWEPLPSAFGL